MAGAEKMRINLMVSSGRDAQIYDAIKDLPPGARARQLKYLAYLGTLVASGKWQSVRLRFCRLRLSRRCRQRCLAYRSVLLLFPRILWLTTLQQSLPRVPCKRKSCRSPLLPIAVVFDLDDVE